MKKLYEVIMGKGQKYYRAFIFLMIVASLILTAFPVLAVDELYLTGTLNSVDVRSGTVTVNVKSQHCRGLRRFRAENVSDLEGEAGREITFFINSQSCRGGTIYTMRGVTRTMREKR